MHRGVNPVYNAIVREKENNRLSGLYPVLSGLVVNLAFVRLADLGRVAARSIAIMAIGVPRVFRHLIGGR